MMDLTSYICPSCGAAIPTTDVNVATDVALCRACGKASPFSRIAGVHGLPKVNLAQPPRFVVVGATGTGQSLIIYKRVSPIIYFFAPFTLLWSGISLVGLYGDQLAHGFSLWGSLAGLPFLFGTLVLIGIVSYLALGRWEIAAGNGEGSVFVGIGKIGWRRAFRYSRDSVVTLQDSGIESNGVKQKAVTVSSGESSFKFGALIEEKAKLYIAASLQQLISKS